ncbi:MAG TPA: PEP-CTERM sorting domain-containing protein [bacterium]|nr:PEP-CTERM sorting domain-containing protein [bacterium]
MGQYIGDDNGDAAYRNFDVQLGSISSFTVKLRLDGLVGINEYGSFFTADDSNNRGIEIGFSSGPGLAEIVARRSDGSLAKVLSNVNTAQTYTVTITNVNFSAKTYSAQVDAATVWNDIPFSQTSGQPSYFSYAAMGGNTQAQAFYVDAINIQGSAVPEPSSVAFFGIGLLGLAGAGWRKFRKA